MKRFRFTRLIFLALFVVVVTAPQGIAAETTFKLKGQTCFGLSSPLGQNTIVLWKKLVEEMSGGQIEVQLFDAGEIVPANQVFEAVSKGVLDFGLNTPAWQKGKYPAGDLFYTLPGGVLAFNDLIIWMYGGDGLKLEQEMYGDAVVVFPLGLTPPEEIWTNKPINTLEDIKGLKIRTAGLGTELWERLGASVVTLPGGEVLPSLQRGLINSAEFLDASMDYSLGIHEILKYRFGPPIHMSNNIFQLLIKPSTWQKLPDDLKAIVKTAAMAATIQGYSDHWIESIEANAKLEAAGVITTKLSKEDQAKAHKIAMEIIEDKAKTDPFFAKVWASQKAYLKKYKPYNDLTSFD
ncbi:MAG: TRAP transporter substrate-binding protein DctP [Spirochaetales bacterium]|jgi:TRAP-type mannitol/chloroaromatic compound transport system substrate-binding protein|nr:TRAP transporter substrate-binding protein DctP [Spirochaetales bacterium]